MLRDWSIHHAAPFPFHPCNSLGRQMQISGISSAPFNSSPRIRIGYSPAHRGHSTDRCSFLPESRAEKNKSADITSDRDVGGILLFLPLSLFFAYKYSSIVCYAPSLPKCLDRSANHFTPGISLSPALLSSLSLLPRSLSLSLSLTAEVCSAPPFLIGLL